MGKAKLKKTGQTRKTSKSFPVEDVNGNKHILKATIVTVRKDSSAAIVEDQFADTHFQEKIIRPPLNQAELSVLSEFSSELEQVTDAMEIGIHGFGGRLILSANKKQEKKFKGEIAEEKNWLDALIHYPNPDQTWKQLTKATRGDLEKTGNAWWELVPSSVKENRYSCINKLDAGTVFLTKVDKRFDRKKLKYIDDNLNVRSKTFTVKFRRILQALGNKRVWFKQFGDPRVIDRRTGEVIAQSKKGFEELPEIKQKKHPKKVWANEVYHYRKETSRRTPYGMPSYTGNIIAVKGSRSADETNIITQQNNHVPSMVITVAGGQLTGGSVERIQEFVDTQIKGDSNYSKFLIIEGESSHDSLSSTGSLKVDVKPLNEAQISDELWQSYDKNNASKIRRSFRLPPILVGETTGLNRATAQASERMAEKWVFNPEREDFDDCINQIIMQQEFRFWKWKTNSPNVTNDEDLVKILASAEKTGGLTPRISRMLLEDILNKKLPPVEEKNPDFDPDIPFSLSLAAMTTRAANANAAGTFSPQGQIPNPPKPNGRPRNPTRQPGNPPDVPTPNNAMQQTPIRLVDDLFDGIDPHKMLNNLLGQPDDTVETLAVVRNQLEDSLDIEAFGRTRGDYFDHEH